MAHLIFYAMFKLEENVKQLIAVQPEYAMKYNLFDTPKRSIYITPCDIADEKNS